MNRILTIVSVLVFLLIVGISPPIVADFNSSQHTALILSSNGNITNSSQHLLVKNNGSSNVLYFIDDQGSGLQSEVFAIKPNSTQNIDLAFSSPAEVMQLAAYDFSSNLRISNMINESVSGLAISKIVITPLTDHCYHFGNCVENFRISVSTRNGNPFSGVLTDNRGDPTKIANDTGILFVGGGWGETLLVYIVAGGTYSNPLFVTL